MRFSTSNEFHINDLIFNKRILKLDGRRAKKTKHWVGGLEVFSINGVFLRAELLRLLCVFAIVGNLIL